ncbi:MAG: extracellular solute-binding protein, partial [Oscillospiraceae bacterium]|nr:extracellular solute-binding protein [Oscillospiraceae bacterium]
MKKETTKKLSLITAAAMTAAMLTSCGSNDDVRSSDTAYSAPKETTTATMAAEDAEVVEQVEVDAEKLENGKLRWLSFWSLEPEEGETVDVFLQLFKTKYGGEIEYIPTTDSTKYDDLATLVLGGNSPDMFPAADLDTFPGKASAGMFQPMDEYIDFDSELFPEGAKRINDMHTIGGKHYIACVAADAGTIILYNKNTIDENGFDDPAELAYNNEWTWSAFKQMCYDFTDTTQGKYAIDGWWYELAMMLSTGVPVIGMENGEIVNNVMDPNLARVQELFREMHNAEVNFPRAEYNWKEHPEKIGEGTTLFYPVGSWQLYEPNISAFGDPGEIMFVPMPRDENADEWYLSAAGGLDAYAMCKGAPNPEAVAAFIKCKLTANTDESVKEVSDKKVRNDYG